MVLPPFVHRQGVRGVSTQGGMRGNESLASQLFKKTKWMDMQVSRPRRSVMVKSHFWHQFGSDEGWGKLTVLSGRHEISLTKPFPRAYNRNSINQPLLTSKSVATGNRARRGRGSTSRSNNQWVEISRCLQAAAYIAAAQGSLNYLLTRCSLSWILLIAVIYQVR